MPFKDEDKPKLWPDDARQLRSIQALQRALDSLPPIFVKAMSEMLSEVSKRSVVKAIVKDLSCDK